MRWKWNDTTTALPPMTCDELRRSDEVLCQDSDKNTFIGYVVYEVDEEFGREVSWFQQGRDMCFLDDIVRWIELAHILPE